ncbi:unnamed protein product, partial [Prorocentrum cordatum]
ATEATATWPWPPSRPSSPCWLAPSSSRASSSSWLGGPTRSRAFARSPPESTLARASRRRRRSASRRPAATSPGRARAPAPSARATAPAALRRTAAARPTP